jgi:hypothetical protein
VVDIFSDVLPYQQTDLMRHVHAEGLVSSATSRFSMLNSFQESSSMCISSVCGVLSHLPAVRLIESVVDIVSVTIQLAVVRRLKRISDKILIFVST